MPPKADFACLSPKCRTEGGATVYELPVGSKVCPVCGSRRVQRIWTPPHVNHGHAKAVDAIAEAPITAALSQRDEIQRKARLYPMVNAVPMRNLGATLQQVYQANGAPGAPVVGTAGELSRKAELGGSMPATIQDLQGVRMPREVAAVDREYRVVKGQEGPEIQKA